jgi:hypothetical protein
MSNSLINISTNSVGKAEVSEEMFEVFNFNGLLFIEGREYMPMASLFINKEAYIIRYRKTMNCLYEARTISNSFEKTLQKSISHLMFELALPSDRRTDVYKMLNEACSMIKAYKDHQPSMLLGAGKMGYKRTSYESISNSFFQSCEISTYYLQSMKKLQSGRGLLYHEKEEELLMAIVFKASLLKYQKLHFLTTGKFDWNIVEFWIQKDIDTPRYPNKGLRKMYRSMIKPIIEKFDVPIVEKASLNNALAASFQVPQSSLQELENWKKEIVTNALQKERESMSFTFTG